ncbi:MAG: hypothetical protein IT434_07040 [Phycisphaerales bacterium]|jgi:putative FmdB family regulatory protein|nr:hypothetical protein [Phycisphaerales bacterium]
MPTYDYRCKACNHEFELFQSMSDAVKKKCPACGKSALERLIGTGAALVFKGSGFYQTDYRSESYKKAAKAESSGGEVKSTSDPASGAKSDAKADGPKADAGKAESAKPESKPVKADSKNAAAGESTSTKSESKPGGRGKK